MKKYNMSKLINLDMTGIKRNLELIFKIKYYQFPV
jgi:hypothetical protein